MPIAKNDRRAEREQRDEARHMGISFCSGDSVSPAVCARWAMLPETPCAAGRVDDGAAFAGDDQRAGEQQVARQQRIAALAFGGAPRLGQRFAGQRRQVDAKPPALDQPAVGRHLVALDQQHDVAGHQFAGLDLDGRTVAPDLDALRRNSAARRSPARRELPAKREGTNDARTPTMRRPVRPCRRRARRSATKSSPAATTGSVRRNG
jgi:hypothetical protein